MSGMFIDNKRIAKNTFFLYVRMFVVTLINLYTVRVVLDVLGVENYGIYNVVAGVISSLSFLTTVLSSATQRFYSFSLGKGEIDKLRSVFNVSLRCYLWLALIIVVLGETAGLWLVNSQLSIPETRMTAALYAYHFSILSFVLTILQIPFSALMIAKEDMKLWSIITIGDSVFKLLFAVLIAYVTFDVLIAYGASLSIIWLIVLVVYIVIGRTRYRDICVVSRKLYDKALFKEMISYSGWSLYGSVAGVGINQGVTIIINLFFTPVVNAARAIALQINGAITVFCNSFIMAVRPPIVKSYASGDIKKTAQLFYFSNKFLYYCTLMICLPLILEMDFILQIWLKEVSEYMVIFSQYAVVCALILVMASPITMIMQASGDIRNYHVIVESFTLLIMPVVYIVFKLGYSPQSSYVVMAVLFLIAHILRVVILSRKVKEISVRNYFVKFVGPATLVTIIASFVTILSQHYISGEPIRFIATVIISVLAVGLMSFSVGLTASERHFLVRLLKNRGRLREV